MIMFGNKFMRQSPAEKRSVSDEERKRRLSRSFIMLGLALGMLLSSLDQTVVGTSLPKIVAELGGMSLYSWLFTAYMLASTITIPIAGKLSDRYGRKPVFLTGMGLFLAGSFLAGASTSMEMLVVCRFIQGLGGGAMMPVSMATVADLYAPVERGKIQGILGSIFALATVIGPLIGGYIVDHLDWRWVFYVNLPVGVVAVLVTSIKFPKLLNVSPTPIDIRGMVTLVGTLAPALLVVTWGGSTYPWLSLEIIGLSLLAIVCLIAFISIERKAIDPILPLRLFSEPIFTLGSAGLFIMSLGLFGVVSYLPLFLQAVVGMSATNSGELIIPMMMGVMVTSLLSGFLLRRTGYKIWIIIGPPIAAVGLYLLSTLHSGSSATDAIIFLIITGAGLGAVMSNYIVAAQNVMPKKDMGVATGSMSLFRSIGGTVGVAALGGLINSRMLEELRKNLSSDMLANLPSDANSVGQLLLMPNLSVPSPILDAIRLSLSNSITYVFFIGAVIVTFALVASVFIRRVPLKSSEEYHEVEEARTDTVLKLPESGPDPERTATREKAR